MLCPHRFRFVRTLLIACCLAWLAATSVGYPCQVISSLSGETSEPPAVVTLWPQPAPQPSLKYTLLPRYIERRSGNAAVWYGKVKAEQNAFFGNRETWEQIYAALEAPIDEMDQYSSLDFLANDTSLFYFIEMGGRCEQCDWQLPVRDGNFFMILLPEIQECRSFARLLVVRAKIQIARGEYDEAVRTLQAGMAMAQHLSNSPTIVSGLVGLAVEGMMLEQIELMTQRPDCPNLYWALTHLPDPIASIQVGIEAERDSIFLSIPELAQVEELNYGEEYWNTQFRKLIEQFRMLGDNSSPDYHKLFGVDGLESVLLIRGYPIAKQVLAVKGLEAETIEKMPVSQAVLAAGLYQFQIQADEVFRRYHLSYPEARQQQQANDESKDLVAGNPHVLPLAELFLPAIDAVVTAETRVARRLAVLRVREAVRLYAAEHEGALPTQLADITQVPLPLDPVTELPFEYRLENQVAHITGPTLPGKPLDVEIRLHQ